MAVDFSATPRGNTAVKKESKSATELVGSMMNVFKAKARAVMRPHRPASCRLLLPPPP